MYGFGAVSSSIISFATDRLDADRLCKDFPGSACESRHEALPSSPGFVRRRRVCVLVDLRPAWFQENIVLKKKSKIASQAPDALGVPGF